MSTQTNTAVSQSPKSTEEFLRFYRDYYAEAIAELVQSDINTLRMSWRDVYRWDSDIADDWLTAPQKVSDWFKGALEQYDAHGSSLSGVSVALVDLPDDSVYHPGEIRNEHAGRYVGIHGDLSRVTTPDDFAQSLVFECGRCGTPTTIPQTKETIQEPHECEGCQRQGPFTIHDGKSEFVDYSKVRVETPAELAGVNGSSCIDGYVTGELVEYGHEDGLIQRAGDRATVYGVIERVPKGSGNTKKPLFERQFRVEAIEFESENETIDVDGNREAFEELAARDDAIDLFKQSIAPELYATEAWQAALELGVAYLFGAPRLDIEDGPTYRGDIHALLVTDYGMGKSTFNDGIEAFSPKCINKSATGLSSDVGLLAAAVKDDFGDGQWTIKPGILVRGNGGHVILDEIDKPDAELARMNDALEGSQKIDIEKAGQSATYQSRVGLLATGNPADSRYSQHEVVAHQIGIDETLLSRFDGIVTMRDDPDTETDAEIAERIIDGIVEASEHANGKRTEFDILERPVPLDVGRAWIQYARENVTPTATKEQLLDIRDWYADEVRQLNKSFADDTGGDGADMPVPATARVVENTYRFAAAFARLHLHEEITKGDVKRAKSLAKQLVSQNWNGEAFDATAAMRGTPGSEKEEVDVVYETIRGADGITIDDLVASVEMDRSDVEKTIEKLSRRGEIYEPEMGVYRDS